MTTGLNERGLGEREMRVINREKLIEQMQPTCRACKKSIVVAEDFVIVVGATYENFFHEKCVQSALNLTSRKPGT